MITVTALLGAVQEIVDARPAYRKGGSGKDGTCDCIGLIIGAIRRAGGKWTGDHSSNWAPRRAMATMRTAPPLELGIVMYKALEPGEAGYSLPARFSDGPDKRDYYHAGVVTSVTPLRITHCTSWADGSGIKIDTKIGKWGYGGRLLGVDYSGKTEGVIPVEIMQVVAVTGSTVRMRKTPSIQAVAVANVPVGARVEVLQRAEDWWEISYLGKRGWMMAMFLGRGDENHSPPPRDAPPPADTVTLTLARDVAEALMEALKGGGTA